MNDVFANPTSQGGSGKDLDFVEYIVKQLVDNQSDIHIEKKVDDMGIMIYVTVAKEDMGRLIGKNGRTVDAIRAILRMIGAKENLRINLKVLEPQDA